MEDPFQIVIAQNKSRDSVTETQWFASHDLIRFIGPQIDVDGYSMI
jgi:hypothetical protein